MTFRSLQKNSQWSKTLCKYIPQTLILILIGPDPQRAHHNTVVVSVQELFALPKPESINATNTQEEAADSDQFNTGHSN